MDIKELYWLAGIIEGEGCFDATRRRSNGAHYPHITVNMTDEDVVRRCHAVAKVGTVYGPHLSPSRAHHQPIWTWKVGKMADAVGLMMTLYPIMGERRQAKIRERLAMWQAEDHPGRNPKLTHCHRGHLYDDENTYTTPSGIRSCRECTRVSNRALRLKRKALV
jgi:hypothetical protein